MQALLTVPSYKETLEVLRHLHGETRRDARPQSDAEKIELVGPGAGHGTSR